MQDPVTSEDEWISLLACLPHWQPARMRTVVIAPHPDDETLATGGLIAALQSQGVEVVIVAVTDGESAYFDMPELANIREREQTAALACLGVASEQICRLQLPDSDVASHEEALISSLLPLVSAETQIVAPWRGDFHPDHEACGRAAETVAKLSGAPLTSYFFWTWHRGTRETMRGLTLDAFPLSKREQRRKHDALMCHQSQLEHIGGEPILPKTLLHPAYRPFEVFLPS